MNLEEVLGNLREAVERYENVPLIETKELSEILRILGVNISYLVTLRKEYYQKFKSIEYHSNGKSASAKRQEAEFQVQELDYIRKVLDHYNELRKDIRSQISLWKNIE